MSTIAEFPRLQHALELLGLDSGNNINAKAVVPDIWLMRAQIAEAELLQLTSDEVQDLVYGGDAGDREKLAARAPASDEFLNAAFDGGELVELLCIPWTSIFDARDAENRIASKVGP